MQRSKIATLVTVSKVIEAHTNFWCYASQRTLLNLLYKFHQIEIKRRQLNYHLADLRREGLVRTWKRNYRREDGTFCLLSSATCLTLKGATLLYKLGSAWALRHIKSLKKRFAPSPQAGAKDPGKSPGPSREVPPRKIKKNPFLDAELRQQMGLPAAPPWKKQPA